MRWLVDAMNVIGSSPDGWWQDREAAIRRLVEQVDRWAAAGEDEVVVVLERPPPSPISMEAAVVAHAARARPDAADDEIVRILRETQAVPTTVVTSDRRLAARAKAAGATVEPASRFRRRLEAL